jgi:hypothetical protein
MNLSRKRPWRQGHGKGRTPPRRRRTRIATSGKEEYWATASPALSKPSSRWQTLTATPSHLARPSVLVLQRSPMPRSSLPRSHPSGYRHRDPARSKTTRRGRRPPRRGLKSSPHQVSSHTLVSSPTLWRCSSLPRMMTSTPFEHWSSDTTLQPTPDGSGGVEGVRSYGSNLQRHEYPASGAASPHVRGTMVSSLLGELIAYKYHNWYHFFFVDQYQVWGRPQQIELVYV